jgi:hypothetical protein
MALIIGDDFYTTAALHTKKGRKSRQKAGISGLKQKTRTQHRNNCIAKKKRRQQGQGQCAMNTAYVVPKSKDEPY